MYPLVNTASFYATFFEEINQDKILEEGDLDPIELLTRLVQMAMIDSQLPAQRKGLAITNSRGFQYKYC